MKTVLRLITLSIFLFSAQKTLNAQCATSDILIQHIVPTGAQTAGSCHATFDLSFTMESNNGNKFIFFHAWRPDLYPNYFDCVNGNPGGNGAISAPEAADLANAFLNIGIDNSGTPVLLTAYPPSAGVILNTAASVTRTVLPNGSYSFVIRGVVATLPGDCNGPILITADFWSSQSANAQNAQCVSCNVRYALNFTQVAGFTSCSNLAFNAAISNRTSSALTGTYVAYADVNNDGFLNSSIDLLIKPSTPFAIPAGPGTSTPITGAIPAANINQNILIVVTLTSPANGSSLFTIPGAQCAALPVTFKSFTAERKNSGLVALKWETATEVNNSGFAIERNVGGNLWETVLFIPSQASGGNSNSSLVYTYDDQNSFRTISQYRIRQVDFTGSEKLSEVRFVRGDEKNNQLIVYPNPSNDGSINVLFDNTRGNRDIVLSDMSGRTVKSWKGVTANSLQIGDLGSGMYTLKVILRETGSIATEKIIVY